MKIRENKHFILGAPAENNIGNKLKMLIFAVMSLYYKILLNLFYPRTAGAKKYKVSVCAIFKDEAVYLREWIEYHLVIGIDHFYLYNNFSSDNYKEILEPYIKTGQVDLIEWPVKQGQMSAYKDCIEKYSKDSTWIGFIDLDEFVVPVHDDDIYSFLNRFEKNRPVVILYWKVFGSSGLMKRDTQGLVTEDFTVCWRKPDEVGKIFFNTKYSLNSEKAFNHFAYGSYKGIKLPPVNCFDIPCVRTTYNKVSSGDLPAQINHYFTKSFSEYKSKMARGDAFFELNPHDEEYFYAHEAYCGDTDYKIYKYLIRLKRRLGIDD